MAVLGLGSSGLSTVRSLVAAGAVVWAWDDDATARRRLFDLGLAPLDLSETDWSAVTALVMSPGIAHTFPAPHPAAAAAKAAGVPLISDVELLYRAQSAARFLAVTGTNGKSTTTALLGHILKQGGYTVQVGGNLGPAALDFAPLDKTGIYVLELSSYQLELLDRARFDGALLLNITPDHLERHGGFEGYAAAKQSLFSRIRPGGWSVVSVDDAPGRKIHEAAGGYVVPISTEQRLPHGVSAQQPTLSATLAYEPERRLELNYPRLPGRHNRQNIAGAYALARAVGMPHGAIAKAIGSFPGLAHRQEWVAQTDGVTIVNDSKATNAEAAAKALEAYDRIHWILGGQPKETGLSGLEPFFAKIRTAYLIGAAAESFGETLRTAGVDTAFCMTLDKAVPKAIRAARKHPPATVLLSPACASWDQFRSFEARGDAFKALALQEVAP